MGTPSLVSAGEFTIPRGGCPLDDLEVGIIHVPQQFARLVAFNLLQIFPRLNGTEGRFGWEEVDWEIRGYKGLSRSSSKNRLFVLFRSGIDETSPAPENYPW